VSAPDPRQPGGHGLPQEVHARYEVVETLGRGGQGLAVRARDRETGREVVLKVLDFIELTDWKEFELWQRESQVLRSLDHPAIPQFIGHFPEEISGAAPEVVVTVQEFVEGTSLEVLLAEREGALMDEEEARAFLVEMLGVLSYFHSLNPPVVHRDIKPSNIVRRPDGSHALIDFGAAQSSTELTGSTTFVGTNGYMPPEQLMGRAETRSDLYALGATVVELVSGLHPSDLAEAGMKLDLSHAPVSDGFRQILARLTDPVPERRYESASRARDVLASPGGALVVSNEAAEGFKLVKRADGVTAITTENARANSILWNTLGVVAALMLIFGAGRIPNLIFALGLAGAVMIRTIAYLRHRIFLLPNGLGQETLFRMKTWKTDEIIDVRSEKTVSDDGLEYGKVVLLTSDAKTHVFGNFMKLELYESRMLAKKINQHVESLR
jgi:hypothetical protein